LTVSLFVIVNILVAIIAAIVGTGIWLLTDIPPAAASGLVFGTLWAGIGLNSGWTAARMVAEENRRG
jgi:putative effector of murein hydrolase